MKQVLVLNAGSSSLKFQVMDMDGEVLVAKGLCDRIGIGGSVLKYQPAGREAKRIERDMPDHFTAISLVFETLTDPAIGVIASMDEIIAVGHRVPHGGEDFDHSAYIDVNVMQLIRNNSVLAPLHSPPIILGIEACQKLMPNTPMVAVFDTAFHQTMPPNAYLYGLPYEDYEEFKIRRFGFHGSSHLYVSRRAAELMGKPLNEIKTITCHLGNGSSLAAVKYGKSVDTTMGFTPLEGIPMGTRSGTIDPAIIFELMQRRNLDAKACNAYLQKKSGVLGLSGVSSDFRDLHEAAAGGNTRAKQALDVFAYAVRKTIGAYAAAMEGVDCVVFTGGIGENDAAIREASASGLEFMGIKLDAAANQGARGECLISAPGSPAQVWVIPTDEELVIARDALKYGIEQR